MSKRIRYSPEVKERTVRMLLEHQDEYQAQWQAICSIAAKTGCTNETLRSRLHQAERDQGARAGLTTSERKRLKQLEREKRGLRRANETLRKASDYPSAPNETRICGLRFAGCGRAISRYTVRAKFGVN